MCAEEFICPHDSAAHMRTRIAAVPGTHLCRRVSERGQVSLGHRYVPYIPRIAKTRLAFGFRLFHNHPVSLHVGDDDVGAAVDEFAVREDVDEFAIKAGLSRGREGRGGNTLLAQ